MDLHPGVGARHPVYVKESLIKLGLSQHIVVLPLQWKQAIENEETKNRIFGFRGLRGPGWIYSALPKILVAIAWPL
jgi:hypothetical protein